MKRFFFYLLFPVIVVALLNSCSSADSLYPRKLPGTPEEINEYVQNAEAHVMRTLDRLISMSDDQKNSENVMRPWNRLANDLTVNFNVLIYLTKTNGAVNIDAAKAIHSLRAFLFKAILRNADVYRSLIKYIKIAVKKDGALSPYERYEIYSLLQSCENIKDFFSPEEKEEIEQLKALIAKEKMHPYIYLTSQTPDKVFSGQASQKEFTVLTLNTCFMPGDFPYLYGGVLLPWQKRIKPLTEKILTADADVICLQEVFTEDASYALYDALKNRYTYFYAAIGPRQFGFSFNTMGLPSGLFVASKYPIKQPQFTLFSSAAFPMNYGFFDFIIKNGSTSLGHIYTTHLQSLDNEQLAQIRSLQLKQIIDKMQADLNGEKDNMPFFLCGDLNIPYGSNEPGEVFIKTCFYDDYNKDRQTVDETSRTCTHYFTNYHLSPTKDPKEIDPNFQILDYALLLKSFPSSSKQPVCDGYVVRTTLIPMNELSNPEGAVSDHHGLLATITCEER